MQRADNSRPADNGVLRRREQPAVSWTTANVNTRVRPPETALCHRLRSARAWLTTLVERARIHVSQKRLMSDSSVSREQAPMEAAVAAPIITVTAEDVMRRMKLGERFSFVDARTIDEWIQSPGRIERSVRMTVSEVEERLKALPRARTVVTYCAWPEEEASSLVAFELAFWRGRRSSFDGRSRRVACCWWACRACVTRIINPQFQRRSNPSVLCRKERRYMTRAAPPAMATNASGHRSLCSAQDATKTARRTHRPMKNA